MATRGGLAVSFMVAVMTPFAMPTPDYFRPDGPPAPTALPCQRFRGSQASGASHRLDTHARSGGHAVFWTDNISLEPDYP
jgi:hypothetical protein